MSLSARDRRALDSLEDQLAGSDPQLASLMATLGCSQGKPERAALTRSPQRAQPGVRDVHQLTGEDYENLLAFRVSLRRFEHWSQARARDAGLTPAQHQLLLAVKGHRGEHGPAVSDLAGYLLLRPHSTVELIDRAEAAGLVERWGDDDDGRVTRVRLTAAGEASLSRLAPAHLEELQHLAPVLGQLAARWTSPDRA